MPPPAPPRLTSRLWNKWKSIRFFWRRQFLVGADLSGNTFWEFKDAIRQNRWRRIVKHTGGRQTHYADVKISPQWHQWLRHTREEPPSIAEQQYEIARQERMKQLAAEADERWNSIPSFLDAPKRQQPQPAIGVLDPGANAPQTEPLEKQGVRSAVDDQEAVAAAAEGKPTNEVRFKGDGRERRAREEAPWEKSAPKGGPSEGWQPGTWTPGASQRGG
ncbi:uncharacterized protein RCC_08116 [Ramularia collo-cygni]|uniref:Uncharacterized protein n=1 Tax=Ramularia collo-cygni TaxID=112498 RepID=A0A2D3VBQ6_9PEZI|nr:uncharacterized protein RCC_08116 [Ramularia collo-cygni]CZT22247.1 uncharacterized protein RCC_08116 [Ramularia collo-cygni]